MDNCNPITLMFNYVPPINDANYDQKMYIPHVECLTKKVSINLDVSPSYVVYAKVFFMPITEIELKSTLQSRM